MNAAGIIVGNFDGTGGDDIVVPGSTGGQKVTIGGATYVYNNSIWRFSSTSSGTFSTPSRVGPAFSAPEGIVQVASYNGNGSEVSMMPFSTVSDFGASTPLTWSHIRSMSTHDNKMVHGMIPRRLTCLIW